MMGIGKGVSRKLEGETKREEKGGGPDMAGGEGGRGSGRRAI